MGSLCFNLVANKTEFLSDKYSKILVLILLKIFELQKFVIKIYMRKEIGWLLMWDSMSTDSPMDEISNAKMKVEDLENEIKNIDERLESIKDISDYKSNTEQVKIYENAITFYKNLVMAYKIYIKTFEKNM